MQSPELQRSGDVPEKLYSRIRAAIEATPAAATDLHARAITALVFALAVTLVTVLVASQMVYGQTAAGLQLGLQTTSRLVWVSGMLLILTCAATAIALWRGRTGFGASAALLVFIAALVTPLYALLTVPNSVHAPDFAIASVDVSPFGIRCFALAVFVGVAVLASFAIALHRAVPVASYLRSAVLGAAAGAWAGLAVFGFCPSGDRLHLVIGHVLPIAALTALGLGTLPRFLRP